MAARQEYILIAKYDANAQDFVCRNLIACKFEVIEAIIS